MKFSELALSFATKLSFETVVPKFACICHTGPTVAVVQILDTDLTDGLDAVATLINKEGCGRSMSKVAVVVQTTEPGLSLLAVFYGEIESGALYWVRSPTTGPKTWSAHGIYPQIPENEPQVAEVSCLNPLTRLDYCGADMSVILAKFKVIDITYDS